MTLLLVFFVLLFSMSDPDIKKMTGFQQTFQSGLGVLMPGDKVAIDTNEKHQAPASESTQGASRGELQIEQTFQRDDEAWLFGEIARALRDEPLINAMHTAGGVLITLENGILFPSGSADLSPGGYPLLGKVAEVVGRLPYTLRIEGHTDDVPIRTTRFASNWELSVARAVSVVKYFIHRGGIAPVRLSAAGYGASKPLVPNDGPLNRRKNRRVEIILEIDKGR
jgi:chemotaxis protein MotB